MKFNTLNKRLLILFLGLGSLSSRTAFAGHFVQPYVWNVDYAHSGLASKTGAGVAVGLVLGGGRADEFALEVARVPWKLSVPGPLAGLGTTGSGHLMPVLLSYRHYFGAADRKCRLYFGASVGLSEIGGESVVALSGQQYSGDVSTTKATYGASMGVSVTLTPTVSADLGYLYLQTGGTDIASRRFEGTAGYTGSAGPKISLPALDAHILVLGLIIRF